VTLTGTTKWLTLVLLFGSLNNRHTSQWYFIFWHI